MLKTCRNSLQKLQILIITHAIVGRSSQHGVYAATNSTSGRPTGTGNGKSSVGENEIPRFLWLYVSPVILLVGVVGNCLILMTMTRRTMRGTSTCVHLVSMAVLDFAVLLFGLIPDWLEGAEIVTIKELHPALCKLQKFLSFVSGDAAVWVRVVFTLDRFVAVSQPLYSGPCCGRQYSARLYSFLTVLVAVAKNLHFFWTRGAELSSELSITLTNVTTDDVTGNMTSVVLVSNCGKPTPQYKHFETFVRPWIAFALISIIPFVTIAVCNAFIIHALVRRHRQLGTQRPLANVLRLMSSGGQQEQDHLMQVTAMCLAASALFLVCTTPSIVLLIGKANWSQENNFAYEVAKAVNNQVYYVVFVGNFFLYCLTARRFRVTLRSALRCRRVAGLRRLGGVRTRLPPVNSRRPSPALLQSPPTNNDVYTLPHIPLDSLNGQTTNHVAASVNGAPALGTSLDGAGVKVDIVCPNIVN